MRYVMIIAAGLLAAACTGFYQEEVEVDETKAESSFFTLSAKTIDGEEQPFSGWEGKAVLVVNVASKCGYTPQYEGLQGLHEAYGDKGLVVAGFPSNDFGGQEPGSAVEIKSFCSENYGVSFPMFEKVVVGEGEGQSPVYAYLGAATGKLPGWNFGKYLIGRDGQVIGFWDSRTEPSSAELKQAIEKALG